MIVIRSAIKTAAAAKDVYAEPLQVGTKLLSLVSYSVLFLRLFSTSDRLVGLTFSYTAIPSSIHPESIPKRFSLPLCEN
jgi:hypothetical protein